MIINFILLKGGEIIIKKIIRTLSLAVFLTLGFLGNTVYADSTGYVSKDGTVNSHMTNYLDSVDVTFHVEMWHSSGDRATPSSPWTSDLSHWWIDYPHDLNPSDTGRYKIYDTDAPSFFTGTSRVLPVKISRKFPLPQSVKNFINVYGTNQIGMKFTFGDSNVVSGQFYYKLTNDSIYIEFTPILKYDPANVWKEWNQTVYNACTKKAVVPWMDSLYGGNWLSVQNGTCYMVLTKDIIKSAYKGSDGLLHFNSSTKWTYTNNSTGVSTTDYLYNITSANTFFSAGNNGIYQNFPGKVIFYDAGIKNNGISITETEYTSGSTYWVKSGDSFKISTSGTSVNTDDNKSIIDDVVAPTEVVFNVKEGSVTNSASTFSLPSSANMQKSSGTVNTTLGTFSNASGSRNSATYSSSYYFTPSGDKDYSIYTSVYLTHFSNANFNDGNRYKGDNSAIVSVNSDATKPTGTFSPNGCTYTRGTSYKVSFKPSDSRSGVKRWRYSISTDDGVTYNSPSSYFTGDSTKDIVLSVPSNATTRLKIKVEIEDNVGWTNTLISSTYNFDNTKPTITITPMSRPWDDSNGEGNKSLSVNVSASDSGSGLKKITIYARNKTTESAEWGNWDVLSTVNDNEIGSSKNSFTKMITLDTDNNTLKIWQLKAQSEDNTSNLSDVVQSNDYKIDKIAPSGTFNPNNATFTGNNISTIFTPTDSGSGVKSWRYRLSADSGSTWGDWINGINPINLTTQGKWVIEAEVTDKATNVGTVKSGVFDINKTNLTIASMQIVELDSDNSPEQVILGKQYRIKSIILNNGVTVTAPNYYALWFYQNNFDITMAADNLALIPSLAPNQTYTTYFTFKPLAIGNFKVKGFVDCYNTIVELREDDNMTNISFETTASLSNFRVTDVKDPLWKNVFRDINGNLRGTEFIPSQLPVDKENNFIYTNAYVKLGYSFYFNIDSYGFYNDNDKIAINPSFYYYDGVNRKEIDIYYEYGDNPLIKVGSSQDVLNIFYDNYNIGSFTQLVLDSNTRDILSDHETWKGRFYLPANSKVVEKGAAPYPENFLKNGYIIVNFKVQAISDNFGVSVLYDEPQWLAAGNPKNINYRSGDIILFYTDKNAYIDFDTRKLN
jgi:hypothetical protein